MDDDYGVELDEATAKVMNKKSQKEEEQKIPSADSKETQDKTPIKDAPTTQPVQVDDEENMFQEDEHIGSQDQVDKFLKGAEKQGQRYTPQDTYFVILEHEMLCLNHAKGSWQLCDFEQFNGMPSFIMGQNSAVVKLPLDCKHSHALVIGGVDMAGQVSNHLYGVQFFEEEDVQTGAKVPSLRLSHSNQREFLPQARFMHQACIVKHQKGQHRLLVIGGKVGDYLSKCYTTASCIGYDIEFLLNPQTQVTMDPEGKRNMGWHMLNNMSTARANFALSVIDNLVYVYGGISGTGQGKEAHHPKMSMPACERYEPLSDKWETIEIDGGPEIGAFGWTNISPKGDQILIVGGTDGFLIQQETWTIDFKAQKAVMGTQFDYQITCSKLIHRPKDNTVYCFGGYASLGENYKLDLKEKEPQWESYERKHGALISTASSGTQALELVHYNHIYFE